MGHEFSRSAAYTAAYEAPMGIVLRTGGNVFYLDPVSGDRRLKRRYVWAFAGFALGLLIGKLLL